MINFKSMGKPAAAPSKPAAPAPRAGSFRGIGKGKVFGKGVYPQAGRYTWVVKHCQFEWNERKKGRVFIAELVVVDSAATGPTPPDPVGAQVSFYKNVDDPRNEGADGQLKEFICYLAGRRDLLDAQTEEEATEVDKLLYFITDRDFETDEKIVPPADPAKGMLIHGTYVTQVTKSGKEIQVPVWQSATEEENSEEAVAARRAGMK